jgi:TRAP-type mannitol/chloroaromatic compound transport system permease small subunit
MLLTFTVVIARYWFDTGLTPIAEAVVFLHACVFMLGIAYTLRAGAHVRVDIIYQRLSRRGQAIIDLLGALIFLMPVALFIFIASIDYVALSWRLQEGSPEPGGLPGIYLLKGLIPLMAVLLGLQGMADIIRCLQILLHPNVDEHTGQDTPQA